MEAEAEIHDNDVVKSQTRGVPLLSWLAMAALLAGCSAPSTQEADESPTETPSPEALVTKPVETVEPSSGPTFDTAAYLANLSHDPFLDEYTDGELLELADAACNAMPGAEDLEPARAVIRSTVADPDSINLIVWTAIPMNCPEFEQLVEVDLGGVASPAAAPEGEQADSYLAALRAHPWNDGLTDDMLTMQGQTICDGFTRGDSLEQTMIYFQTYPTDVAELAVRAAVDFVCPEHRNRLD